MAADPGMETVTSSLTDLHTHILPGVDDGAVDLAEATAMARVALDDGIHTLAATPHNLDLPQGTSPAVLAIRVAALQRHLQDEELPLRVVPGAEVAIIASLPQQIDAGVVPSLNGSRYLLLEMPLDEMPSQIEELIFQVQVRGYVPVLAHPERSAGLAHRPDRLRPLVERGVLVQITGASLEGAFGKEAQTAARYLLEANLAHVIASDAHDATHRPPRLGQAEALAARIIGAERAHALVAANPATILADRPLDVEPPRPPARRWFWQR